MTGLWLVHEAEGWCLHSVMGLHNVGQGDSKMTWHYLRAMQGLLCTTTAAWTTAGALEECVIHDYVYPLAVFAEVRLFVIATDFMERVAVMIRHSIASSASDAAAVYRGAQRY